jgi:hypothetical protein
VNKYIILLALLMPSIASATRNVSSPVVNQGEWRSEARYGFEWDDKPAQNNRFQQFYYIEHGVSNWYALRLAGRWSKLAGQDNDFTTTEIEQRVQLFEHSLDGWDGGFKIVYAVADNAGAANTVDVQWLAQQNIGSWTHRFNIITKNEVGTHANGGTMWDAI